MYMYVKWNLCAVDSGHREPATLKHAADQTTAASVQHAFEATEICVLQPRRHMSLSAS